MKRWLPAALSVSVLLLTGCSASAMTASGSAPATPPPTSPMSSTQASRASIPTECTDLIASTPFTESFGTWPLNDPAVLGTGTPFAYQAGSLTPTPAPSSATLAEKLSAATQLRCVWRDPGADVTSMMIEIATVDPQLATDYQATLPAKGYTCDAPDASSSGTSGTGTSGRTCRLTTTDPKYNVEVGDTSFVRGNIYIHVEQANVSTPDLIPTLESRLWS